MSKALELAKFGREVPPTGLVVGDTDTQTLSAKTFSDMPVFSSGAVNGVAYLNGSKALTTSSNLVFNGTVLTVSDIRDSSLTSGRVTYASTAGNLVDSANLTFDGTTFTVGTKATLRADAPFYTGANLSSGAHSLGIGGEAGNSLIGFFVNNTEQARLTATGLGLGTNSPAFAGSRNGLIVRANSTNGTELILQSTNATVGTSTGFALAAVGNDIYYVNRLDGFHAWITGTSGNTERMRITASGNLSIGSTSNPSDPGILVSRGNNTGIILVDDEATGRGAYIRATGSSAEFGSTSSIRPVVFTLDRVERARIDTAGNFLVGTNSLASGFATFAQIQASGTTGGVLINSATNNIGRLMFTNNNTSGGEGLIRYDGNDKSMQFWTNAGERMRITTSGNVGIGTTSPSATLTVAGILRVEHSGTGAFGIQAVGGAGAARDIFLAGQSGYSNGFTVRYNGTNMAYAFQDGNVGIGTTGPSSTLDIFGQQTNSGATSAGTPTGTLRLAFDGAPNPSDYGASLVFSQRWWTGSTQQVSTGQITGFKSAANGQFGGGLAFWTSSGESNTLAERVRINAVGNVLIGTQTDSGRLSVAMSGAGASSLMNLQQTTNGTNLTIASPAGIGQYMWTAVAGDTVIRTETNSLCIATASTIKFGTPSAEWGRFTSAGSFLVGTTSAPGNGAKLVVSAEGFPATSEILADFRAGTTNPTAERYVLLSQSYTGSGFDSPTLAFRANGNASNQSSFGTISTAADGSIVFRNIGPTNSAITAVTEKARITSAGTLIARNPAIFGRGMTGENGYAVEAPFSLSLPMGTYYANAVAGYFNYAVRLCRLGRNGLDARIVATIYSRGDFNYPYMVAETHFDAAVWSNSPSVYDFWAREMSGMTDVRFALDADGYLWYYFPQLWSQDHVMVIHRMYNTELAITNTTYHDSTLTWKLVSAGTQFNQENSWGS